MVSPEEEARDATLKFYQALDDLLLNKGTASMSEAWHHDDFVTAVHPTGHWARGWSEVWATWEELAAVFSFYEGHATRSDNIGTIDNLQVAVLGDVAYATSVYRAHVYFPQGEKYLGVHCTNILRKSEGVWKIVHHHPDQAPPDFQDIIAWLIDRAGATPRWAVRKSPPRLAPAPDEALEIRLPAPQTKGPETLRLHQSNERTMAAWLRTGIALMAFGFALARFSVFLRQISVVGAISLHLPHSFGSAFVGAALVASGMLTNLMATVRYIQTRRRIERGEVGAPSSIVVYVLGTAATLVGLVMTILLVRAVGQ